MFNKDLKKYKEEKRESLLKRVEKRFSCNREKAEEIYLNLYTFGKVFAQ